jgi:hypothetical protein
VQYGDSESGRTAGVSPAKDLIPRETTGIQTSLRPPPVAAAIH